MNSRLTKLKTNTVKRCESLPASANPYHIANICLISPLHAQMCSASNLGKKVNYKRRASHAFQAVKKAQ